MRVRSRVDVGKGGDERIRRGGVISRERGEKVEG